MSSLPSFSEALIKRFIELIANTTGISIRPQDQKNLSQKIFTRMKALRMASPDDYYALLASKTSEGEKEWQAFVVLLTNIETYFFRDSGQISLLRDRILPELIEKRQQAQSLEGTEKPSLRIWSAGCSTGEEPYSLAILVKELLPNWQNWDIFIVGTDINRQALSQARQGRFGAWSFRSISAEVKAKYFHPHLGEWQLDQSIKNKVTFLQENHVKSPFPNLLVNDIDLIICRNVFVYFNSQAIATVLNKFFHTLRTGGYLLTGHAELQGQDTRKFQVKVFPESLIYQRPETPQKHSVRSPKKQETSNLNNLLIDKNTVPPPPHLSFTPSLVQPVQPITLPNPISNSELIKDRKLSPTTSQSGSPKRVVNLMAEIQQLFKGKQYTKALEKGQELLHLDPNHFDASYVVAQIYANLGKYQKAKDYCQKAIAINPFSSYPYYVLANIAEEQGNLQETKSILKKIIYLAPNSVSAYLELGLLYQRENDKIKASKMFQVALELLQKLPAEARIESIENITASELLDRVKKLI
ncbi:MAG: CheR family methyltransferase [Chroococcales cyanobacterium]